MRLLAVLMLVSVTVVSTAQTKCDGSINGFRIHTLYVMGTQYNGVAHAYKHLSEETCFTPVTDVRKADAILEVVPLNDGTSAQRSVIPSVSCTSTPTSTTCLDSTGNEMTVECGGNVCTVTYGPDPAVAALHAVRIWVDSRWFMSEARLYTTDYKLLWKSEGQKGDHIGSDFMDKLRLATESPYCKRPGTWQQHEYKTYRQWASTKCGVQFDPLVSIDLNVEAKKAAAEQVQNEQQQMIDNAKAAAAKQQQKSPQ